MVRKIGVFILSLLILSTQVLAADRPKSVGIFYTQKPPLSSYFLYDWLIIDPHLISPKIFKRELFWLHRRAKIIAYLSVGEVSQGQKVPNGYILGQNPHWKSSIIDIRQKGCKKYILDKAQKIIDLGFEGFMLDTLDSYQMVLSRNKWHTYENAEISLIKTLHKRYPDAVIIVNRPFRIIGKIASIVDAFLAEGLFYTWDARSDSYHPQKKEATRWLMKKLRDIQKLGLPTIVVDYVDPKDRALARKIASRIKKQGFIPWVADKELSVVGIGTYEPVPRKIMFLYNGEIVFRKDPSYSDLHLVFQMPIEWLGFVPVFKDISQGLPKGSLVGRFAAIFIDGSSLFTFRKKFYQWILKSIQEGIKVFFINGFGIPLKEKYLSPLGLEVEENRSPPLSPIKIIKKAGFIGYESEPNLPYYDALLRPKKGEAVILAENSAGQKFCPLAFTPWGGYGLEGTLYTQHQSPFAQLEIPTAGPKPEALEPKWVVDPFLFFKKLLPPDFPCPDVTTEDGKRLLVVHVDGDAFFEPTEFAPYQTTAEVLFDKIFKVYHIPQSISVIESEIAPWGLNGKSSEHLEKIARKIFSLPWIEPASHTFSHPFVWYDKDPPHLPVPHYKFDLTREITGSVKYIEERILFHGTKRTNHPLLFWSGDCVPPEKALSIAYKNHILSINGGGTTITYEHPFLSRISPMGVNRGEYFQVYAPILNENVYTNNWHGPYDGFLNVISTFKLTDKPRRLKPIDIYYHFFSGKKLASLNALRRVYHWALSQDVKPIFISEYILKVLEFRTTAIAKDGQSWVIKNGGNLRTFRLPGSFHLDKTHSRGVMGLKKINNSIYLSMDKSGNYTVCVKH